MKIYFEVKGGMQAVAPTGTLELSDDIPWDMNRLIERLAMDAGEVGLIILNGKVVRPGHPLSEGDKILFFPIIYGG